MIRNKIFLCYLFSIAFTTLFLLIINTSIDKIIQETDAYKLKTKDNFTKNLDIAENQNNHQDDNNNFVDKWTPSCKLQEFSKKNNRIEQEKKINIFTEKENKIERGIWFYVNSLKYMNPDKIIGQFLNNNINTIYFAGTNISDWEDKSKYQIYSTFICNAYSKGLNVYGVTLEDPQFAFEDKEHLKNEFGGFINVTRNLFDTYIIDVEPHTISYADPLVFVPQYIKMSIILKEIANNLGITYIDTVPYWYFFVIKNIGISSGLDILGGSKVNLMDYSFSPARTIENIKDIRQDIKKPFIISIKTTPGYGEPFLQNKELKKVIKKFDNSSISYGLFEAQYFLRNNH